jgi:hypothetical protein
LEIKQYSSRSSLVSLTRDDLVIFNNALNEALNGVSIEEFETRMGYTKEEVEERLETISNLLELMV